MKRLETDHPDIFLIEPAVFPDERGHFLETYHEEKYAAVGAGGPWVQDNESRSRRGVIRGLHMQVAQPQAKLVRALRGAIYDVAVDVRPNSPHFGVAVGAILSEQNHLQIYIPRGFAHGFLALTDEADVLYKCDALYAPGDELGIAWNDPQFHIPWEQVARDHGINPDELILSGKDLAHRPFAAPKNP